MDVHPVPYDTPDNIFFPQKLRECGYYCTNNSKTHYNSTRNNKACWDECNKDLGFFLPNSREGHILYETVRKEKYPLNQLYELVET
ncbi:sulfatase AtsG, partial [gut metagenome]